MRLQRILDMPSAELQWRLAVAARTVAARLTNRLRAPQWERSSIARLLDPHAIDDGVRSAIHAQDWNAVHTAIAGHLRSRPARFVLDPAAASRMRQQILARWPAAAADARIRGERLIAGEHDLLGYRSLRFDAADGGIDWHLDPVHGRRAPRLFYADVPYLDPSVGDHKVIWEINRHQHWLQLGRAAWLTGDERYAAAVVDQLESWLAANPPYVGINWASMLEVAFRSLSWTWVLHCLLAAPDGGSRPWSVDLLVGIDRQLTHVEQNLSHYFSPNTHLTGEALALYVVGVALPELKASARWKAAGRRVLLDEIDRQVLPDGGHAERSAHYQRYTLDFYLLALLSARFDGDTAAERRFADAALRLARFTRTLADDDGRLPLLGDDDGGMLWPIAGRACSDVRDSLAVAAAVLDRSELAPWGPTEEAAWIAGPASVGGQAPDHPAEPQPSRALLETGYAVLRDGAGGHAVVDVGAHGYMNGGHAHADALSLTLTIAGEPLLVDPGTSTYTIAPALRDRMRSTRSHNTIIVDGREPSVPSGPFHWQTRTDARLEAFRINPRFDWIEGAHDGYSPLQHRRTVLRTDEAGWLVVDEILGSGSHAASAHWHFHPAWTVRAEQGRLHAAGAGRSAAWLLHDGRQARLFHGDEDAGLGWHAPVYGTLLPSWSARIDAAGDAPMALTTWIGSGAAWGAPRLERITASCDSASPVVAARVADHHRAAVFMLRPGGAAPFAARSCRVGDYETDARVLAYLTEGDRLTSLSVVDARRVATQQNWISIEADEPITDLHVSLRDRTIDVNAAGPLPPLRLRVPPVFHLVRLNGRELPLSAAAAAGILLVHDADWRMLSTDTPPTRPLLDPGLAFARH